MKKITTAILSAALIAVFCAEEIHSSPYRLTPLTDGMLTGTGAALYGLSVYTDRYAEPLSDKDIAGLSENNINRFDRSAADNWSTAADDWSDRFLTTLLVSPAALMAGSEPRSDFITIGIMYGESFLITQGLNGVAKDTFNRPRPFTYNPEVSDSRKKKDYAVRSFYSGHTVNAFNSAVFVSTVFSDYYPESSWRYAVWGTTLGAASVTGYLRYRAGMHFPTDILAGAVIGSLTGWLVPVLHRPGNDNVSLQFYTGRENILAVTLSFR